MPSKLPDGMARHTGITVRLRPSERERLAKAAAERGMTATDLFRQGLAAIGVQLEVQQT